MSMEMLVISQFTKRAPDGINHNENQHDSMTHQSSNLPPLLDDALNLTFKG